MGRHGVELTIAVLATICAALPQKVISAKAGLVYFVQGRVTIEGHGRLPTGARLRQLRPGETLSTERGRAEVLMNPGAVLRLGDMSRLRMDNIVLTTGQATIQSGSAVVTVYEDMPKDDNVLVEMRGIEVVLKRAGIYRFDAERSRLRVFSGRAEVYDGSDAPPLVLKRGQSVELQGGEVARFDTKDTDALERWAEARSYRPRPPGMRVIPPALGASPALGGSTPPQHNASEVPLIPPPGHP